MEQIVIKRVLLIDIGMHQQLIKLQWNTTNPVHHNVIKRYLFKYLVRNYFTQRSCAFLIQATVQTKQKKFLFSTAISPDKKNNNNIWEWNYSLALTKIGYVLYTFLKLYEPYFYKNGITPFQESNYTHMVEN